MSDIAPASTDTRIEFDDSQVDALSLQGRSVLVTGGASGIGLACATALAQAGALVTIADLQEGPGTASVHHLTSQGHKVKFVQCDVTSYEAQVEMFRQAISFGGGKIDIVIPCAGVIPPKEENLLNMLPDGAPSVDGPAPPQPGYRGCQVNLEGVYNTCYLALHYFRLPGDTASEYRPSIILISSLAGYVGFPSSTTYSSSKFGVRGLFHGIRDRAARESPAVRVNLVAPWYIDTAMTQQEGFQASEAGLLLNVMGFAPMERVTDAVLRFAADQKLLGRAAGIFPSANEDLGDDFTGAFGGDVLRKHMGVVLAKVGLYVQEMAEKQNELARTDSATGAATV